VTPAPQSNAAPLVYSLRETDTGSPGQLEAIWLDGGGDCTPADIKLIPYYAWETGTTVRPCIPGYPDDPQSAFAKKRLSSFNTRQRSR
jgi:hypothetical protein